VARRSPRARPSAAKAAAHANPIPCFAGDEDDPSGEIQVHGIPPYREVRKKIPAKMTGADPVVVVEGLEAGLPDRGRG